MNPTSCGLLVTLDGPGGAGKSTTARRVHDLLTQRGYRVHATTEPSRSELGQIARAGSNHYTGYALACLVAADRYHHLDTEIRPQLAAGHIVICDRYVPSSYVLQRMDGVPLEFIESVNAFADIPDLAVILTADPAETAARIARRGAHHRFETGITTSQLETDLYHHAAKRLTEQDYPVLTLDTTYTPPEAIAEKIADEIARRVGIPHRRELTP